MLSCPRADGEQGMAWDKAGGRAATKGSRVRVGPTGRQQRVRSGGWQWSDEAEDLFLDTLAASCDPVVVAEINQGGLMVKSVLRAAGLTAPIKAVRAKQGKAERAVPIALLFEQGRVSLHGEMGALEEELRGLIAGGAYQGPGDSPDRADAMVWALGEVMAQRVVRVRGF